MIKSDNMNMNGAGTAELVGITYAKLDYWTRSGVIAPTDPGSRGHDREFTPRGIEILRLAALMRQWKYSLAAIKFAIDCLNTWGWDMDKGPITLTVMVLGYKRGAASMMGTYIWKNGWTHQPIDPMAVHVNTTGRTVETDDGAWRFFVTTDFQPPSEGDQPPAT